MIVPDLNLMLYATLSGFPQHARAKSWWEDILSGDTDVGLVSPVVLGFIRLTTGRRLLEQPMTADQSVSHARSWLAQPYVQYLPDSGAILDRALDLLTDIGAAGNLTTDAQIAAHALNHGATVATNDTDFTRFPGVQSLNPLLG